MSGGVGGDEGFGYGFVPDVVTDAVMGVVVVGIQDVPVQSDDVSVDVFFYEGVDS